MRTYKKRTKSTKTKTYQDYLDMRADLLRQGYELKSIMTETQFNQYYKTLSDAKRNGEIKTGAWQTLKSKEKYITWKQARTFAIAKTEMMRQLGREELEKRKDKLTEKEYKRELNIINKIKYSQKDAQKLTPDDIRELGKYINSTKESGLYGGDYE